MSDKKSKMPDLQELGSMANKLFKDVKKSVTEIVCDYKKKRDEDDKGADKAPETKIEPKNKAPSATKPAKKPNAQKPKSDVVSDEAKSEVKVEKKPVAEPTKKDPQKRKKDKE